MQPLVIAKMREQIIETLKRLVINFQAFGKSRRWLRITAYIIAVLFLAILLVMGWKNRETILPFLIHADYSQLAGYFALYLISYVASATGWLAIMLTFENHLSWWTHVQIYCMTMATRLLPGTLWYVGGRMLLYQQLGLSKTITLLANAIELIVLYITASVLGLIFLFSSKGTPTTTMVLILIASIVIAALALRPRFFYWILKKVGAPQTVDLSSSRIALWIVFYSIMWLTSGLMLNQLVNVFKPGDVDQMLYVIGAWTLSTTASMLTLFLPSGFGVKELAITALLAPILPLPLAGTVAILMRFLTTILEVAVSVVFYLIGLKSPPLEAILNARRSPDYPLVSEKVK